MDLNPYLSVKNLTIRFVNAEKPTIDGVSFSIPRHGTLALVGESGSGKTLIAETIGCLRSDTMVSGKIILGGQSLLDLPPSKLIPIRRHRISYIFQEPNMALNPVLTIGYQLVEIMDGLRKKARALDMLKKVGFSDPKRIFNAYVHELSGGMQQRAMIAIALINDPKLLIADEPTTALDVVLQKQILESIGVLQRELGFAILFITHDFSLLQRMADQVCVLNGGKIVERGTPAEIIFHPKHSHTQLLCQSVITIPESRKTIADNPVPQ
ncbi:MAG: ABC transporter ATP-binding protein [Puniceicoccales bacterium]|jgi:ABC-type dipeptide/oligopeptide/nickel transport system ATPase component|nr:ABC transporter ATP-binding protein [Puniceicoccales bacterium]